MAEQDGRLIGMCALIFSMSTWSASPVCELQDVLVTEDHRRADVGRGLVEAAEQIARARGCTRLFLLAEYWNLDAHAFYRSLGLAEKTCLYFERDLRTGLPQEGRHVEVVVVAFPPGGRPRLPGGPVPSRCRRSPAPRLLRPPGATRRA